MSPDSGALWNEACDVLCWHKENVDTCIQTLNRLWRKSPWVQPHVALPTFIEGQIRVTEEQWSLERLVALLHERQRIPSAPKSLTLPVILVRWNDTVYLIDGRRRINHWERC